MPSIYRTARGAALDIDNLRLANETTVAVGNQRVNARGDQLDERGQVVQTREQVMNEHYKASRYGNRPKDDQVADSSSAARRNQGLQADAIDAQKLQSTIDELTRQLAEKDAQISRTQEDLPPLPNILSDEIDTKLSAPQPGLRGGLANAIQKQKDSQEAKSKSKRI